MLGDSLLVAPIFNEEGVGEYYLPQGTWTDFLTGEVQEGGRWYSARYDYLSLPMMVKEGSVIALGSRDDRPDYDYADGVELRLYELHNGCRAERTVYGMDNRAELTIRASRHAGAVTLDVEASKPYTVRLVNVQAVSAEGADIRVEGSDTLVTPRAAHMVVNC